MTKGNSERCTAVVAMAAVDLFDELRDFVQGDGVLTHAEAQLLRKARTLKRTADDVDVQVGVLLVGFRKDGITGGTFRRKLREYDGEREERTKIAA